MLKVLKKIWKWFVVSTVPLISAFFIISGIVVPIVVFHSSVISKSVDYSKEKVLKQYKIAFNDDAATLKSPTDTFPYTLHTNSTKDSDITITQEDYEFKVNNKPSHIYKYSGTTSTANKVLVFSHGLNGTGWTAMEIARSWIEKGYTIYSYDQRQAGENKNNGNVSFGYHEGDDLSNLIGVLSDKAIINPSASVILYGRSNGTGTILSLLEKHASQVNSISHLGIFLESAYYSPRSALNGLFDAHGLPYNLFMPQSKPLAQEYMNIDLDSIDYLHDAPHIQQKVYIVHGKADKTIPYKSAVKLDEHLRHSKLTLYDGLGHLGVSRSPKYADKLADEVTTWLGGNF